MRVKQVQIRNYRSFDAEGVVLDVPRLSVPLSIIGPNNSGKTNFIRALLYGLGVRPVNDDTFTLEDFHLKKEDHPILVEIVLEDGPKSTGAFNKPQEMPVIRLRARMTDGVGEVSHSFYNDNGKPIFNPRTVPLGKSSNLSAEDRQVITEYNRTGAERVSRWRSKLPVTYVDLNNLEWQLRPTGYGLLARVVKDIRREFEDRSVKLEAGEGIPDRHVGKSHIELFQAGIDFLNEHILPTPSFRALVTEIERVLKQQLDIERSDFKLGFGQPSADYFFDNLAFFVTDDASKPRLPVTHMGNGFLSLFVVALIRALVKEDQGGRVFIFEEPETFQHEHFQEYFYRVLCEIAKKNQVIYSTHSKKFVDVFVPESIVRLSNPDGLKTRMMYQPSPIIEWPGQIDGFAITNPEDFGKYLRTLEPNIGNLAFAKKVVIVEGPHDLLAYRTVLETKLDLGLKNIAVVAAWGKDTIPVLVQLCKRLGIPFFVIHDWDISDPCVAITETSTEADTAYEKLSSSERGQYTKNASILRQTGVSNVHHNKKHLEDVLGILPGKKSAASVYEKLSGKSLESVQQDFPKLIPDALLNFLETGNGIPNPVESYSNVLGNESTANRAVAQPARTDNDAPVQNTEASGKGSARSRRTRVNTKDDDL